MKYLKMYLIQATICLIIVLIVRYFYEKKLDLIWYGTGVLIGFINADIRNYLLKKTKP